MLLKLAKSRSALKARIYGLSLCLAAAFAPVNVAAEWLDPLKTPAIQTELAHKALLLGVTSTADRVVAVGAFGNIISSDDSGLTWSQGQVPVSVTLTAVRFADANVGWAVGHDGVILKTVDAGKTWITQFDGYRANDMMIVGAEQRLAAAELVLQNAQASGDSDAIYEAEYALESADFGLQDAQYDAETGSTKPFLDIYVESTERAIAIGAYGMFFETLDGGSTWTDISSSLPNPDRLHLNSIVVTGEKSLAVIGEMGFIATSQDSGQSWTSELAPYDGSLFGAVDSGDLQLLYSLRGHVYRSQSNGGNWEKLVTGAEQTLFGGAVGESSTVLVGNAGSVIILDKELNNPRSIIIEGRASLSSVTVAPNGQYVLVGEAGVKILNPESDNVISEITMASGE